MARTQTAAITKEKVSRPELQTLQKEHHCFTSLSQNGNLPFVAFHCSRQSSLLGWRGELRRLGFGKSKTILTRVFRYLFARFQSDLFPSAHDTPVSRVVTTYLSLFIFGFLYQLVLVYDALRLKNTIQIIGLCIYNIGLVIEAAVQYDQIRDAFARFSTIRPDAPHLRRDEAEQNKQYIDGKFWTYAQPIAIATPVFLGVVTLVLSFLAWKLYDEFAWSIYKHISADLRLRRRYLSYQVCEKRVFCP